MMLEVFLLPCKLDQVICGQCDRGDLGIWFAAAAVRTFAIGSHFVGGASHRRKADRPCAGGGNRQEGMEDAICIGDGIGTRRTARRADSFDERELNAGDGQSIYVQHLTTHGLNLRGLDEGRGHKLRIRFEQTGKDPAGGVERRNDKDPFAAGRDAEDGQAGIEGERRFGVEQGTRVGAQDGVLDGVRDEKWNERGLDGGQRDDGFRGKCDCGGRFGNRCGGGFGFGRRFG